MVELIVTNEALVSPPPTVAIYQRNLLDDTGFSVVAETIRHCPYGWHHPFTYHGQLFINVSDAFGNHRPRLAAPPGSNLRFTGASEPLQLDPSRPGGGDEAIALRNDSQNQEINVHVYRGATALTARLFATRAKLGPGQVAAFQFEPCLRLAVIDEGRPGALISSETLLARSTPFAVIPGEDLEIALIGGGYGSMAAPLTFFRVTRRDPPQQRAAVPHQPPNRVRLLTPQAADPPPVFAAESQRSS